MQKDVYLQLLPSGTARCIVSKPYSSTGKLNQSDGQVIASPTGGTTPYIYAWNSTPGLNSNTLTGLDGGTFIPEFVTITDAKGCEKIDEITVQEASLLSLAGSVITDVSCFQGADGQIEADVVGG